MIYDYLKTCCANTTAFFNFKEEEEEEKKDLKKLGLIYLSFYSVRVCVCYNFETWLQGKKVPGVWQNKWSLVILLHIL